MGGTLQEKRTLCAKAQKEGLCCRKFRQQWLHGGLVRDKAGEIYRSWV